MPTENLSCNTETASPVTSHNLNTSAGGRGYIADLFKYRLNRHDYTRYIDERLAADFACTLSVWLDPLLQKADYLDSLEATVPRQRDIMLYEALGSLLEQVAKRDALIEQVLVNAERGLPHNLYRSLRALLPGPTPAPANEAEREPFEAWHRRRFATKHTTGEPTRDMHNGVRDPNYGPPNQQQMWEAWQARAVLDLESR
jgi:hypothetical protein